MRQKFNFSPLQYGWKPLFWALVMLVSGLSLTVGSNVVFESQLNRSTPLLVVTTDANINITGVNAAFSRATGLSSGDAIGKNFASLFNRSDDAQQRDRLDAALATFDFAQGVVQCEALMQKFSPSI